MIPRTLLSALLFAVLSVSSTATLAGNTPHQTLTKLFAQDWERMLNDYPEAATSEGDPRFNDRWTDLSITAINARAVQTKATLNRLHHIARASLSVADQLDYDTFEWNLTHALQRHAFGEYLQPVTHKTGPQFANDIAETTPFETVQDYRHYLSRMNALPLQISQTEALMKEGVKQGKTPPRILLERVPAQIEKQLVSDEANSPFYEPFTKIPDSISASDKAQLQAEAKTIIREKLLPAYRQFLNYFQTGYLPVSRTSIAATAIPDGKAYYDFLISDQTTTQLTAEEIHTIGLQEVARLHASMEKLREEIGFQGDLQALFTYMRTDPKFFYKTPDELLNAYRALAKRIDPELVKVFKTLPRLTYGVRPIPDNIAPDTTTAYYMPGASNGTRPGYYYVNLYKPESRPSWEMVPLTLHESVPGHHFQFARDLELPDAPMFRKTAYFIAYSEGWALYAEQLGYEMGMYDNPYDRFGQLTYEMWRAVRLVVDTGMHAKGWSRDQAIAFFKQNTAKTDLDIVNEIDRYIGDPGQALAYKIGQLKISALRKQAQQELGSQFDLREYNDEVLAVGSVPLTVLENHIHSWIARKKKSA